MRRLGLIGTGLIGASVGLGAKAVGWQVAGWDPNDRHLAEALQIGALDTAVDRAEVENADLIVLAAPPASIVAELSAIESDRLVTDVAGVKTAVVEAGRHLPRFVGGHPMAGRESSGPVGASPALFRGAAWVLTTDGCASEDLARMEEFVYSLGGRPLRMTAQEHDAAVAVISHLPQMLAASLIHVAAETKDSMALAAGSFRDLTRVAVSDPEAWSQLLHTNRRHVADAVRALNERLGAWAELVDHDGVEALREPLRLAQQRRRDLAPPVVGVAVVLADQPGELARVGKALESSKVDIRDLQLRHGSHGGGGVLTLSVRPGEAGALRDALESVGLLLID